MSATKYNHEYELKDGKRILDPIGKMSFNEQVVATRSVSRGSVIHTIDLEKSSNFIVKIEDVNSWIQFVNYDSSGIHRFDVLIEILPGTVVGSIRFGNGVKEYLPPQMSGIDPEEYITPYIFWPYSLYLEEFGKVGGQKVLLTVRYGEHYYLSGDFVPAFAIIHYQWFGPPDKFDLTIYKNPNDPCITLYVNNTVVNNGAIVPIRPSRKVYLEAESFTCDPPKSFNQWIVSPSGFIHNPTSETDAILIMPYHNVEIFAMYY